MEYICSQCKDEWYAEIEKTGLGSKCPHCSMPITQMVHDVFLEEGVVAVLKQLYKRLC